MPVESGKEALRREEEERIQLTPDDELLDRKQPTLPTFIFSLFLRNLIVFTVAIPKSAKPEPFKKGSYQKIILVIFGIFELLERVIKVIPKVGQ